MKEKEQICFDDYIKWIDNLVMRHGVELDYFAWIKIKEYIENAAKD